MANRRMFSKKVTNSSEFLMMPSSAQSLYFHIGMNSDDDGFCELFTVTRMTDSKPDDVSILHAKGFIFILDGKVCIVKDWYENNFIRPDRYEPSKYLKDQNMAKTHSLITGGSKNSLVYQRSTEVRIGKDRIISESEDSPISNSSLKENEILINGKVLKTVPVNDNGEIKKVSQGKKYPNASLVFSLFGNHPLIWKKNKTILQSAENLFESRGVEQIKKAINFYQENKDEPFCPQIFTPYDLELKWENLYNFKKKNA